VAFQTLLGRPDKEVLVFTAASSSTTAVEACGIKGEFGEEVEE
jgi:hypothetical protein